ncbi:MAG TPA: TIGR04552 family protein [Myxococcota bacterium]|nr:TIGR04552 family protein [Myxococcota bacterium]HQK49742.1 TIGR04552 family protein [Myxococcota bacterium]
MKPGPDLVKAADAWTGHRQEGKGSVPSGAPPPSRGASPSPGLALGPAAAPLARPALDIPPGRDRLGLSETREPDIETIGRPRWEAGLSLADVDAVRLLLRGGSVVDWPRLHLATTDEAAAFLRVNGYDLQEPQAQQRLRDLLWRSVEYLERTFDYRFPRELTRPDSTLDLLMVASDIRNPWQRIACVLLKSMHIINHVEATELRARLPLDEEVLFHRASEALDRAVHELQAEGITLVSYRSSRKSAHSLFTKILGRKITVAAQIYDRVRCRLVCEKARDIVPLLAGLKDRLLAWNYVVPGQSRNEIVRNEELVEALRADPDARRRLWIRLAVEDAADRQDWNRFSAAGFRMVNFVVDLPIPVPERTKVHSVGDRLGFLVMQPVEFQVFDRQTWDRNEEGEGSHPRYKDRQRWEVIRRLEREGEMGGGA